MTATAIPTKGDNYTLVGRLRTFPQPTPGQDKLGPQAVSFPALTPSSGTGQVRESGPEVFRRLRDEMMSLRVCKQVAAQAGIGVYDARRVMASVWNEATGHALFSLSSDGSEDRSLSESEIEAVFCDFCGRGE